MTKLIVQWRVRKCIGQCFKWTHTIPNILSDTSLGAINLVIYLVHVSLLECKQQEIYLEHLALLVEPPLDIDSMVPKKEVFSVPQLGHGPYKNALFVI